MKLALFISTDDCENQTISPFFCSQNILTAFHDGLKITESGQNTFLHTFYRKIQAVLESSTSYSYTNVRVIKGLKKFKAYVHIRLTPIS
jgi:hypothetical protein